MAGHFAGLLAKCVGVVESGRGLPKLRMLLVASVAVAGVASFSDPADAQYYRGSRYYAPYYGFGGYYSAPRRSATVRQVTSSAPRAEPKKDPGFGEMPKGPLQIFVSINTQKVTLYSNGVRVAQGPVSTGVPGHPTPIGVFSVIEKDRYHHSNLYSGAPMPFMQRITWSGVALHEGVLPGHPASHGCIRMSHDFAQKLWPVTKLGVRVIVSRPELSPVDFEHAKLFTPRPKPDGSQVAGLDEPIKLAQADEPIRLAQVKTATEEGVTVMDVVPSPAPETSAPERAPNAAEATAPVAESSTETAAKPAEQPQSAEAPASEKAAEATGAITPTQPVQAGTPPASEPTVELRKAVEAPQPAEVPKVAAPAAAETKPAEAAPASTEPAKPAPADFDPPKPIAPRIKNADQPQKRNGQVAVFVSRKEKKIFVRQGFVPLFDMPIMIDEPEHPLGTHVFTAMGLTEDGTSMRWNLITVPNDVSRPEPQSSRRRGRYEQPVVYAPVSSRAPSSAAEALDRIHFPQEVVDRIADLLIPGSSLVVSDEGISRETGRGTDFIVLTR